MDVALISNNISIQKPNPTSSNINLQGTDTIDIAVDGKSGINFNYNDVIMDLDELQDFLFMLIGSEPPGRSAEAGKGANIDLVA